MAVSLIPMPQFRAAQQGYNFEPVAQGLETIRNQQNQNKMMDFRQSEADQSRQMQREQIARQEKNQNAMLDLKRQQMAKGPERPWWAGPNGQVDPAMLAKTQAGRAVNNVNVSSGPQETAYDKEMGKQYAQHKIEGDKGAATAHRELNNLRVMEKALDDPNLYTGTGAGTIQGLKKAAQSLFGLPVQGVASGEIVQNLTKFIAVGLKDNLPGPLSDGDRRFLESLPPGLLNTPEGNRRILGLGMLQKRYQIDRSRAASDYARQNGGRVDQGFDQVLAKLEDQYAQKFSGMIAEMQGSGEMPTRSPAAGMPLDALRKQYGLE